jgi:hypothetical protein
MNDEAIGSQPAAGQSMPSAAPPVPSNMEMVPQVAPVLEPEVGSPLGKDRSPAAILGLSVITLGIYYLVWYYKLNDEIRRHDPDIKISPGWAVVAAMVPFCNFISAYSTAARIRQMQLDDGQTQTISPVVALLLFLFLGFGYPLYVASQVREHWHGHRRAAQAVPAS